MLTILYYCLKVIFCSGVLLGYYGLALRNNRFHQWNRYYLLLATVLPFVLPLLKIPIPFFATAEETPLLVRGVEIAGLSDLYIAELNQHHQFHFSWQFAVTVLYVAVAAFLAIVFAKNIFKIKRLKQRYPCEFIDGIQFYNTQEQGTPFSFFKNIFWNKRIELHSEKGQQMLAHELAHITEKHSTDKVFMELLVALAWWNPVLYFVRKELAVIHEFIADKKASAGDENLQYASLLLMKAMGSEQFALANPFFHSQLKRRLTMLTTSKNPKFSYVRRLMVMPLAVLAIILFSFKYKEFRQEGLLRAAEPLTVIIDAGHGGADDGVIGVNGAKEDAIALQIALKIKELSEGTNIKIVLTRTTDTLPGNTTDKNVAMQYRTNLVKAYNADFFISLHLAGDNNKVPEKARGMDCFVSNSNSRQNEQSRILGSGILDELSGVGLPIATSLKTNKDQKIYVLEQNSVPSVLLELGYITNKFDAVFLQDFKNQEIIAKNILNALAKHGKKAKENVSDATAFAQEGKNENNILQADSVSIHNKGKAAVTGKVKQAIINTTEKYKGVQIETVTPTADQKGVVVKTIDQKVYFLDRQEAKKELNVTISDNTPIQLKSDFTIQSDENDLTTGHIEIKSTNKKDGTQFLIKSKELVSNKPAQDPLYVINGEVKNKEILTAINPNDIKTIDVLKGESATTLYGEKGKNGVIKITTKNADDFKEVIVQGYKTDKASQLKTEETKAQNLDEIVVTGYKLDKTAPLKKLETSPQNPNEIVVTGYKLDKTVQLKKIEENPQKLEALVVNGQYDKTFTIVEQPAQFPGGADGWRRYLMRNLKYPVKAQENGTQGTIRVELTVNPDGSIKNIHALNDLGDGLAQEAERMIINGPKWIPAKQNGKLVTYRFVQAITFSLGIAILNKPRY